MATGRQSPTLEQAALHPEERKPELCVHWVVLISPIFPEASVTYELKVTGIGLWETCKNYGVPGNGMVTPICNSRSC